MKEQKLPTHEQLNTINKELWDRWQAGSEQAFNELVTENRELGYKLLHGLHLWQDEDMRQEVDLALLESVYSWDPEKMPFGAHAYMVMADRIRLIKQHNYTGVGVTLPNLTTYDTDGKRHRFLCKQQKALHAQERLTQTLQRQPSLTEIGNEIGLPCNPDIVLELLLSSDAREVSPNDLASIASQESEEESRSELSNDMMQEMGRLLADEERQALRMFYGFGEGEASTTKHIAHVQGVSTRQVERRMKAGREKLAESETLQEYCCR